MQYANVFAICSTHLQHPGEMAINRQMIVFQRSLSAKFLRDHVVQFGDLDVQLVDAAFNLQFVVFILHNFT
jgi:hypothetical protein